MCLLLSCTHCSGVFSQANMNVYGLIKASDMVIVSKLIAQQHNLVSTVWLAYCRHSCLPRQTTVRLDLLIDKQVYS